MEALARDAMLSHASTATRAGTPAPRGLPFAAWLLILRAVNCSAGLLLRLHVPRATCRSATRAARELEVEFLGPDFTTLEWVRAAVLDAVLPVELPLHDEVRAFWMNIKCKVLPSAKWQDYLRAIFHPGAGSASLQVWDKFYSHMTRARCDAAKPNVVAETHSARVADMVEFFVALHSHGRTALGGNYPRLLWAASIMLTGLVNIHDATQNALRHEALSSRIISNEADALHNLPRSGEFYIGLTSHKYRDITELEQEVCERCARRYQLIRNIREQQGEMQNWRIVLKLL